jgi:hypothetical protein
MCAHLSLRLEVGNNNSEARAALEEPNSPFCMLGEPFSFNRGTGTNLDTATAAVRQPTDSAQTIRVVSNDAVLRETLLDVGGSGLTEGFANHLSLMPHMFNYTDLSNICLDGEDDLYQMYRNTDLSLTGADNRDWVDLDQQMSWDTSSWS